MISAKVQPSSDQTQQTLEMEAALRGLIKGQFSSIYIEFNSHACHYCTVEQAIADGMYDHVEWVSEDEKSNAIADNGVWVLQWYPNTPVSSYCVAASTLAACFAAAIESSIHDDRRLD